MRLLLNPNWNILLNTIIQTKNKTKMLINIALCWGICVRLCTFLLASPTSALFTPVGYMANGGRGLPREIYPTITCLDTGTTGMGFCVGNICNIALVLLLEVIRNYLSVYYVALMHLNQN